MKKIYMYVLGIIGFSLSSVNYNLNAVEPLYNFELWNKTTQYQLWYKLFKLSKSNEANKEKDWTLLDIGKWGSDNISDPKEEQSLFITYGNPDKDLRFDVLQYKFAKNPKRKSFYIRVKEEKGKPFLGPQTGQLLGLKGKTERGYPLADNVTDKDIKESTLVSTNKAKVKEMLAAETQAKKLAADLEAAKKKAKKKAK
jgi:coenzyme F420-reducing hydrogenase alpha subunit